VFCNSSHSAVKSGSNWDLIAFRFSYVISRGDNSISHKETRPVAEGLFNTSHQPVLLHGLALVENRASVPVRLGLQSRLRNRD
jgi:hypothetical protein